MCNWASAESDLELTRSLVEEEISRGWVYKFDGDLSDAQAAFPTGVAIGKLGVATSDSRPPRLVVDNSMCGLNARCHIPERSTLPTAKDVLRSYPLRGCTEDFMAQKISWPCLLTSSQHISALCYEKVKGDWSDSPWMVTCIFTELPPSAHLFPLHGGVELVAISSVRCIISFGFRTVV